MKFRRTAALIGIILLLAMYASTMIFALMDNPLAKGLLMGSVFCTVAVPVLLYAILLVAKNERTRAENMKKKYEEELSEKESDAALSREAGTAEDQETPVCEEMEKTPESSEDRTTDKTTEPGK